MSRVGKKPVEVPSGVKVALSGHNLQVEGPKGKISFAISPRVKVNVQNNTVLFERVTDQKTDRALHGTMRTVVANMIKGVSEGFHKELLIEGVGFKAQAQGATINLSLGFSHPVIFQVPQGLTVETPKPTQILIKGVDKVLVGQFAAKLRKVYEAEPYKGKGIRYSGEIVRRKAGKTVTK